MSGYGPTILTLTPLDLLILSDTIATGWAAHAGPILFGPQGLWLA